MVTGVILAAGGAKRMGQAKQLLPLDGKPMVWHVASAACQAKLDTVIVITGAYQLEVTEALADLPLQIIDNENWQQGQSSSVKQAVASIPAESQAVMFLLADQPFVDKAFINHLIDTYRNTKASIIIPRFKQRPGNPVVFDLVHWRSALLQLSGDEGARQIIRKHQKKVSYVEVASDQPFFDMDTPEEYEGMKKIWQAAKRDSN